MIDPELQAMIDWVDEHRTKIPEIDDFLVNLTANHNTSLQELAEEDEEHAWAICDALFEMEEDTFTDEMLHEYLKKNQPPRREETELKLDGL